jgi:hypothetical protein
MAAIGGSPELITIAGREFTCVADADIGVKLGGDENEVKSNGNGTSRIIKTVVFPAFSGVQVQIDNLNGDLEFLQSIADGSEFVPTALTYADGVTYSGQATIIGEIQYSSQNAAGTFDMNGTGRFNKQ